MENGFEAVKWNEGGIRDSGFMGKIFGDIICRCDWARPCERGRELTASELERLAKL